MYACADNLAGLSIPVELVPNSEAVLFLLRTWRSEKTSASLSAGAAVRRIRRSRYRISAAVGGVSDDDDDADDGPGGGDPDVAAAREALLVAAVLLGLATAKPDAAGMDNLLWTRGQVAAGFGCGGVVFAFVGDAV